ncbi:hypothetical protein PGT21_030220 [Puccinia graminis f. sp. tritici]|uniref:Uncharacterized protein n=1 Tax=Puccinia graminis f. sp. tritici TaxID=56615 RepID=A0A5B0PD66_PUCGR|nr:hypothetical protein PGT21_030220 [Puccinia graminis f. sp. tritici]KAA1099241.1 hypothetical protein PGTUg99_024616 [Puccinia graminis f. sp. tritici]
MASWSRYATTSGYAITLLRSVKKYGEDSFSKISVFKPETANNAHSESRNFNELGVRDSPYAMGGPTFGWDPHTGQRSTKPSS